MRKFNDDEIMRCDDEIYMTQEAFARMYAHNYEITFATYNDGRPITRKVIVRALTVMDAIEALCEDEQMHVTQVRESPIAVIDATNKCSRYEDKAM